MSTNYYRVPSFSEMQVRREKLLAAVVCDLQMPTIHQHLNPYKHTMWDEFREGSYIHLGKRSAGWRFLWNFHDNKYYHDAGSLFEFIRAGLVIDEYGAMYTADEFIEMAMSWCPEGHIYNQEYVDQQRKANPGCHYGQDRFDTVRENLVICSSVDFS